VMTVMVVGIRFLMAMVAGQQCHEIGHQVRGQEASIS